MNEIVNIREGNDFALVWPITRNGQPEDLSRATNIKLIARIYNDVKVLEFERVDTNKIRVEFTPTICRSRGVYKLEFRYDIPDSGFADGKRSCAVDRDAFRIVASTAEASDPSEFTVPGEMAIAFIGPRGPMPEIQMSVNDDGHLIAKILN